MREGTLLLTCGLSTIGKARAKTSSAARVGKVVSERCKAASQVSIIISLLITLETITIC
jgi:hypothetical protein